ncbi:hypothetical protein QYE76_043974 [Lolium multiflorum]|uniref:Uncharacterized protein n=1 Tax=Lolium multiflorum TaxID=4521 RepID=A0AAD8TK76_LOLMU|nr:hypothetical protein QYE76_043974 [Lolium multiflorum]
MACVDAEMPFVVMDLNKARSFDPTWHVTDAQTVCATRVLASRAVWGHSSSECSHLTGSRRGAFWVLKEEDKHFVPMYNDPCRSSYADHLYKKTFDGFIDIDIAKTTILEQPCPQLT